MILASLAEDYPALVVLYVTLGIVWLVFPFFVMRYLWKIHQNVKNLLLAVVRLLAQRAALTLT